MAGYSNINIGKLRKQVQFQADNKSALGAGFTDAYTTFLTTRCHLEKKTGNRNLGFGEITLENEWTMFCRFQTALVGQINSSTRCVIDGKYFTIKSYDQVDEKRFWFTFTLSQYQQ